jgi:hypothetical protein
VETLMTRIERLEAENRALRRAHVAASPRLRMQQAENSPVRTPSNSPEGNWYGQQASPEGGLSFAGSPMPARGEASAMRSLTVRDSPRGLSIRDSPRVPHPRFGPPAAANSPKQPSNTGPTAASNLQIALLSKRQVHNLTTMLPPPMTQIPWIPLTDQEIIV